MRGVKNPDDKRRDKRNREVDAATSRRYNLRIRKALLEALGGCCVRCGYSDWRALQVDHVNGNGRKDCETMVGMKNTVLLRRVLSGSTEYQLLCANCNWIKKYEKKEFSIKYR